MEYLKLCFGIGLTVAFFWILIKNSRRTNFIHSLLRVDTILGVFAGLYLIFSSLQNLIVQ